MGTLMTRIGADGHGFLLRNFFYHKEHEGKAQRAGRSCYATWMGTLMTRIGADEQGFLLRNFLPQRTRREGTKRHEEVATQLGWER